MSPNIEKCPSNNVGIYPTPIRNTVEPQQISWGSRYLPNTVLMIALYGIMEDIRDRELKFWKNISINTGKLPLDRITHLLFCSQVIASFSQTPFP